MSLGGPDDIMRLTVFKSGMQAAHDGRDYFVDHVNVRGFVLYVRLEGVEGPVNSEQLRVRPAAFTTVRREF